jgi:lipase
LLEDDAEHLEEGEDGRLRYRYCKSAVITAWSVIASPPPPPARVPTLIVLGEQSWLLVDEHVEAYRAELGSLLEVVTVPGGHTVFWDALDDTAEAVARFLA